MKPSFAALGIALALTGCASEHESTQKHTAAKGEFTLQLLHISDMDGSNATALANAGNLAALVTGFTSQYPKNTVFLSSGDNYILGSRYDVAADESMKQIKGITVPGVGRADIAMLNAMGLQVSAVGNHDLDGGSKAFAKIVGKEGEYPGAQFPYLSVNMDFATDSNTKHLVVGSGQNASSIANGLTSSTVIEVDGQKIGIVGVSTPTNDVITKTDDIGVYPLNDSTLELAALAQKEVDTLSAKGINKIIVLAHMQSIRFEKELAGLLKNVDVIVAGGSNTLFANQGDALWDGDKAEDSYPVMQKDADNKDIAIVNVDADYKYLGRLVVRFNDKGELIKDSISSKESGPYITDERMVNSVKGAKRNPEVDAIVNAVNAVMIASEKNILGHSSVYLNGTRGHVRTQETNLGNLTADANLWYAKLQDPQVMISLKNGGGIRADIGYSTYPAGATDPEQLQYYPTADYPLAGKQVGDISQFDVQSALAFNNSLAIVPVSSAQLLDILEDGVSGVEGASGGFTQVGGLCMSYDGSKNARQTDPQTDAVIVKGERVRQVIIDTDGNGVCDDKDSLVINDGAVVSDGIFKAVTLSYLSSSAPYPCERNGKVCVNQVMLADEGVMTKVPKRSHFAKTGTEQDALAEYLTAKYPNKSASFKMKDSVDKGAADARIIRLDAQKS